MTGIPSAIRRSYKPFQIRTPGWWLVISDMHFPYHDRKAIEAALKEGRRQNAKGILINGDALDFHEMSSFDRKPSAPRYVKERKIGIKFFSHLRETFPQADIVYKDGNHEERLEKYIIRRAPALYGIELLSIPALLNLDDLGIKHVGEKRVVRIGKLPILHGHEYTQRQVAAPVNPARGLYLKTKASALCGHHHQTSEHNEKTLNCKQQTCWSVGCLCQLAPDWQPLNKWNLGFAMIKLEQSGLYHVRNLRIMGGKIL